jgi:hypothetical protein
VDLTGDPGATISITVSEGGLTNDVPGFLDASQQAPDSMFTGTGVENGSDGGGGGGGDTPARKLTVNSRVLQDCINQLLGRNTVRIASFTPSTPGGFGEFKGVGPDAFSNGGRVVPITVKNDAATYNATQVGGLCRVAWAFGCTAPGTPGYPYTNYTNNNNNSFGKVTTQIHELGHSLWTITAGSGLIPEPNGEAGDVLENCVTMHHGIK